MLGGNNSIDSSRIQSFGDSALKVCRRGLICGIASARSGTLGSKEGIVFAFVFDGAERAMTRAN
jgi:hypothetical protein